MDLSGTIDGHPANALPRIIERVIATKRPGRLLLKHHKSGSTAELKFGPSGLEEISHGGLTGDAARSSIGKVSPWQFEFVSNAGAEYRTGRKPAIKLTGAQRPAVAIPERRTAPVLLPPVNATPSPATQPVPISSWPTADSLAAWVDAGDEFSLRFSRAGGSTRGNVSAEHWDYFNTDHASAMQWAETIGEAIGFTRPGLAAIVEPDRAACYRQLADGFAGAYSGPGCTVDQLVSIP